MRLRYGTLAAAIVFSVGAVGTTEAQVVRDDFYVTDGSVRAMALSGNALYIGGTFGTLGPATGCAVPIDAASGAPEGGFPKIAGTVNAVATDGNGGWFMGGDFRAVGGIPRSNLAHVLADHTLAPWDPSPDGVVLTLAVGDGVVFAGGQFASVGGQTRHDLAALDATTGLATAFDPNPDGGLVGVLERSGATLYAAGDFANIGGQSRTGLAALDVATGLASAWDPHQDGTIAAVATNAGTIYVGGGFTSIGGQMRNCLAALDSTTGLATDWNPGLTADYVAALAVSGSRAYVGGSFSYCTGTNCLAGLGAFDVTSGLPTAWESFAYSVDALAVSGTTLYVAGEVGNGLESRSRLAALDAVTGQLTTWDPKPNNTVHALAVDGTRVFAGGEFTSLGGVPRSGLAALDVTTGLPTDWNPELRGSVSALALSGSTLYVGGDFTLSIPVPNDTATVRHNLAAFDLTTGEPTAWNPNATTGIFLVRQRIATLAASGSTVYVGGRFNRLGGKTRNYLAAVDGTTGEATDWNPSPTDSVAVIAVDGGIVYVGGAFDSIGAEPRGGLAALNAAAHDSTDGVTTAWDPKPFPTSEADRGGDPSGRPYRSRGPIHAISATGNTVYVGGTFELMGGLPSQGGVWRRFVAALDATTGLPTAWDAGLVYPPPGFVPDVSAVIPSGGAVYVGGVFGSIGGVQRGSLAALDAGTAVPTAWNPDAYGSVYSLLVDGPTVYAGGSFNRIGNQPQSNVAAMGDLSTPTLLSLTSANAAPGRVQLTWYCAAGRAVTATVYRRTSTSGWNVLAEITGDGTGRLVYEDGQVSAATRYGYRLGVRRSGREEFLGEAWVDVPPALAFALAGARPNPAAGDVSVALSLPDASPARLDLMDVAGRRVAAREVGPLGPGNHLVSLARGHMLPAGVYLLRLSRGDQSLSARVLVLR